MDFDLLFPPISTIKLQSEYFSRYIKSELFALSLCTPSDGSRVYRYSADHANWLHCIIPSIYYLCDWICHQMVAVCSTYYTVRYEVAAQKCYYVY